MNPLLLPYIFNIIVLVPIGLTTLLGGDRGGQLACQGKFPESEGFHPHLHCVVTGGGLSPDGQHWVAGRENYFLPVRVLGQLFRGKFLARLKASYQAGQLTLSGSVESLRDPANFRRLLGALYRQRWIVYAKPPFGGAKQVYQYLGRYTHRVAISNRRLVSLEQGRVTFHYKDYADDQRRKQMTLDAEEFIRRVADPVG